MSLSNWFYSQSSGEVYRGDPGAPIGQSLRFRGTQYLEGPVNPISSTNPGTLSMWIKDSTNTTPQRNWFYGNCTSTQGGPGYIFLLNNGSLQSYQGNSYVEVSNALYRDPSAWYHIVIQSRSDGTSIWVNGELQNDSYRALAFTNRNVVFNWYGIVGGSYKSEGYMADIYQIDGQELDATTFGRFNAEGIWVPVDPRLDDDSPANYSSYLTTPSGSWDQTYAASGTPPIQAFDGGTSEYVNPVPYTAAMTFAPAEPLPIGNSFRVWMCHYADSSYTLNGDAVDTSGWAVGTCGWFTITNQPTTLTNFTMNANTTGNWLYALEIDGVILKEGKSLFSWSGGMTTDDPVGFSPSYPASNAFDGSTTTWASPNDETNSLTFTPTTPIEYSSSVRIYCCTYADQTITVNGDIVPRALGVDGCGWQVDIQGSGTFTEFVLGASSIGGAYLYAIEVDGVILTNGSNPNYGPNGFHLTFEDPNDIGKDVSGNGNDFTATGFDTVGQSATGYYANAVTAATGGEIPTGGTPYCVDIVPATANIGFTGNSAVGPDSPGSTADTIFDGKLDTWLYWTGDQYPNQGDATQFRVDLRDFTADSITKVECFCSLGNGLAGVTGYDYQLLDASKVAIAGTSVQPTNADNGQWLDIPVSGTPQYLEISTDSGSNRRNVLYAIRVNGVILQQESTITPTYDLMLDSPTQNYATLNPLQPSNTGHMYNANLMNYQASVTAGDSGTSGTIELSRDDLYYWEVTIEAAGSSPATGSNDWGHLMGLFPDGQNADRTNNLTYYDTTCFAINFNSVSYNNFGSNSNTTSMDGTMFSTASPANSVFGILVDRKNNRIKVFRNGVEWTPSDTSSIVVDGWMTFNDGGLNDSELMWEIDQKSYYADCTYNFGQQPFKYTPPEIVGDKPLDGTSDFQVITGFGDADGVMWKETTISQTNPTDPLALSSELGPWNQTATYGDDPGKSYTVVLNTTQSTFTWRLQSGWTSGAAMYVSEDGTTWRNYDGGGLYKPTTNTNWPPGTFTVDDGTPIKYVRWMAWGQPTVNCGLQNPNKGDGILGLAQTAFPNGLWWIKDMDNTNQHQFVDSLRTLNGGTIQAATSPGTDIVDYVAPSGNSVAWCWSAPDTFTPTVTGSLTNVDGRRNVDAGFSMVRFTSSGVDATYEHGLSQRPEFILSALDNTSNRFGAWHYTEESKYGLLQDSGLFLNAVGVMPDATNNTVVGLQGASIFNNTFSDEYVTYAWHSVPGYSKFGSYEGTGDKAGPYIHLGFQPAYVIIKRTDTTGGWNLRDSTRHADDTNSEDWILYANTTAADFDGHGGWDIQFLPLGFQVMNNPTDSNASGGNYIYAAWAGEAPNLNVTPATEFQAITGSGADILSNSQTLFPSGLWWIKDRENPNQHQLVDSVRGGSLAITSPAHRGEIAYAAPTGDSVAWCWNYNSADPSINGFDIVEYVGDGTISHAVNHNLGKAPEFMIVQTLCNTCNGGGAFWATVYHAALGATRHLYLNNNNAAGAVGFWGDTEPTSTQFTVGKRAYGNTNTSGQDIVAYLWTSIPGYSAFGSYIGNGNADGPFVRLGFKPAFVLIKATTGTNQWMIVDSTRNPTNPVNTYLFASLTNADQSLSAYDMDFLANGFKPKSATSTDNNSSGVTYVYAAFAENPFKVEGGAFEPLSTVSGDTTATILDGKKHFQAISATGPNILSTAQSTFDSGLWWIKDRTVTQQHQLVDSVNGTSAVIQSPARTANNTYTSPTGDSVAWCWNAENTDGGFSISDGTHGLGVVPAMVIDRNLNVWHQSLTAGQGMVLSSSAAAAAQTWTVDATTVNGPGGGTYYTWSEIPGYSAFGSYTGNANVDGPFVYLGFRPAFTIIKQTNGTWSWWIQDTTRSPYNPSTAILYSDNATLETSNASYAVDFLSNGFKIRNSNVGWNTSGGIYIYAAFAENPFTETGVPVTAR